jgi:hypothetical protein
VANFHVRNGEVLQSFTSFLLQTEDTKKLPSKISSSPHWWLMPVILVTWETEIRRIKVPGNPRQRKFMRPHLNGKKMRMVVHNCYSSHNRKHKIRLLPGQDKN